MSRTRRRLKREIRAAVRGPGPIAHSDVERWIASGDLRVLMELNSLIFGQIERVVPAMSMMEVCGFVEVYFERLFLELPRGTYAMTLECISWFRALWNDPSTPRQFVQNLKQMLAEVCRSGNRVARDRAVYGVLEHLFESPEIAALFSDWKDDPELKDAYCEALDWGKLSRQQGTQGNSAIG